MSGLDIVVIWWVNHSENGIYGETLVLTFKPLCSQTAKETSQHTKACKKFWEQHMHFLEIGTWRLLRLSKVGIMLCVTCRTKVFTMFGILALQILIYGKEDWLLTVKSTQKVSAHKRNLDLTIKLYVLFDKKLPICLKSPTYMIGIRRITKQNRNDLLCH